jgi:hypothetical protein
MGRLPTLEFNLLVYVINSKIMKIPNLLEGKDKTETDSEIIESDENVC